MEALAEVLVESGIALARSRACSRMTCPSASCPMAWATYWAFRSTTPGAS